MMLSCYQYKGCWIEIFAAMLEMDEDGQLCYYAAIELPDRTCIETEYVPTREGAFIESVSLIDEMG